MKVIEWAIEALAMLDVCVNIYCFFYVIKTFNTKHCLNYIMCIDSIVSVISSLLIITFYAIGLQTSWTCSAVTVAVLIVPSLMVVYHFIKAYIRYKRVWTSLYHQTWKTEAQLIQDTTKALSLTTILLLIMVITDAICEMRWIGIYNNCMGITFEIAWIGIFTNLVRVMVIIVTIHLELKCLKLVQKIRNHSNPAASVHSDQGTQEQRHVLQEIPMRSTILNFGLILCILVPILIGAGTGEQLAIGTVGLLVCLLFKGPLSVFWTVRVNEINARIDKEKDKVQRRQLEIEEALKKRDERRTLSSMVQIQPLELQDFSENEEEEP